MAERSATAQARLNARMASRDAVTMTYRRSSSSCTMSVTRSKAKVSPLTVLAGAVADRDVTQPSAKHVDHPFYFNSDELDFGAGVVEPAAGDTLEVTEDSRTKVYILSAPFDGSPNWDYVSGKESNAAGRIRWNGRLKSVS